MRNAMFFACVALACQSISARQQPPSSTFRSNVNFVEIPVRVVDSKGTAVGGLDVSEFRVVEDGVVQTISTFRAVGLTTHRNQSTAPIRQSTLANPSAVSGDAVEGIDRVYVFLIDDYHLPAPYSAQAKRIISTFVRDHLRDRDVAAAVYVSGISGQGFTNDRSLLLAAIDRLRGSLDLMEPASVREIKARAVLATIRAVSSTVEKFSGRRKALVYFGPHVDCRMSYDEFRDVSGPKAESAQEKRFGNLSSAGTGAPPDAGNIILCNNEAMETVRQATSADVTIYSVDPRGLHNPDWVSPAVDGRGGPDRARVRSSLTDLSRPSPLDGFYVLSEQTGGFAFTGSNAFSRAFNRIVDENSTYYLIGYYSTNSTADGRFRRHAVAVSRSGLKVEHRSGYFGPR